MVEVTPNKPDAHPEIKTSIHHVKLFVSDQNKITQDQKSDKKIRADHYLSFLSIFVNLCIKIIVSAAFLLFIFQNWRPVQDWILSIDSFKIAGVEINRRIITDRLQQFASTQPQRINLVQAEGAIVRATRSIEAIAGSRILWVDDAPANNQVPRQILEDLGIRVQLATSTREAINLITQVAFDLIISDVNRVGDISVGLEKCSVHFFEPILEMTLDETNQMMQRTASAGFSMAELLSGIVPSIVNRREPYLIFYSSFFGGTFVNQCARMATNQVDVLLNSIVSALEERRWQRLRRQP